MVLLVFIFKRFSRSLHQELNVDVILMKPGYWLNAAEINQTALQTILGLNVCRRDTECIDFLELDCELHVRYSITISLAILNFDRMYYLFIIYQFICKLHGNLNGLQVVFSLGHFGLISSPCALQLRSGLHC